MPVSARAHRDDQGDHSDLPGRWLDRAGQDRHNRACSGGTDKRSLGWFVGWAQKDERRGSFCPLVVDTKLTDVPKGLATRAAFLKELPSA
jgi:beta-lactamase class D